MRAAALSAGTTALNTFDPSLQARTTMSGDFHAPYSLQWSLRYARQFGGNQVFELGYLGTRGVGLFQTRFSAQFSGAVGYSWSHAIDNGSEAFPSAVGNSVALSQNPLDVRAERASSGFDARHALAAYWIWELPWQRAQRGVLGRILGGWQASGIMRVQTAHPFTPTQRQTTRNPFEDNSYMTSFFNSQSHFRPFTGNAGQPPEKVGITDVDACVFYGLCGSSAGVPILRSSPTGFWLLNTLNASPAVFVPVSRDQVRFIVNGPGAALKFGTPFGNVGRNSFLGDRVENLDLSVARTFRVTDRASVRYQLDLFNAFNHPNFGIPNSINLDNAGSTFFNFQENDGGRRTISMSLHIVF